MYVCSTRHFTLHAEGHDTIVVAMYVYFLCRAFRFSLRTLHTEGVTIVVGMCICIFALSYTPFPPRFRRHGFVLALYCTLSVICLSCFIQGRNVAILVHEFPDGGGGYGSGGGGGGGGGGCTSKVTITLNGRATIQVRKDGSSRRGGGGDVDRG